MTQNPNTKFRAYGVRRTPGCGSGQFSLRRTGEALKRVLNGFNCVPFQNHTVAGKPVLAMPENFTPNLNVQTPSHIYGRLR